LKQQYIVGAQKGGCHDVLGDPRQLMVPEVQPREPSGAPLRVLAHLYQIFLIRMIITKDFRGKSAKEKPP
jgi:hypothetical protein